jgi:hydrogenase maturation protease
MEKKILVYGYGNPGRQDDALGNAFVEKLEEWLQLNKVDSIQTDSNYQLNIEDAYEVSKYEKVIFVDASEEPISDFLLTKVDASDSQIEFTMHAVSCAFVVDLCQKMYNASPETYLLHIKGYEWEFEERLSTVAQHNLQKAFDFMIPLLLEPEKLKDSVQDSLKQYTNN